MERKRYSAQGRHARGSAVPRRYDDVSYSRSRIMNLGGCIPNIIGSRSTKKERVTWESQFIFS